MNSSAVMLPSPSPIFSRFYGCTKLGLGKGHDVEGTERRCDTAAGSEFDLRCALHELLSRAQPDLIRPRFFAGRQRRCCWTTAVRNVGRSLMSAMGHKQTFKYASAVSGLLPNADILRGHGHRLTVRRQLRPASISPDLEPSFWLLCSSHRGEVAYAFLRFLRRRLFASANVQGFCETPLGPRTPPTAHAPHRTGL